MVNNFMTIRFTKLTSVRVLCWVVFIFAVVGGRVMGSWAIFYPGDGFFEVFAIRGFVFSGISCEMLTPPNTIGQICDKRNCCFRAVVALHHAQTRRATPVGTLP